LCRFGNDYIRYPAIQRYRVDARHSSYLNDRPEKIPDSNGERNT
jgi:hypothetical protein